MSTFQEYVEEKKIHKYGCSNPFCNDKMFCDFITKSTCLNIYKEKM